MQRCWPRGIGRAGSTLSPIMVRSTTTPAQGALAPQGSAHTGHWPWGRWLLLVACVASAPGWEVVARAQPFPVVAQRRVRFRWGAGQPAPRAAQQGLEFGARGVDLNDLRIPTIPRLPLPRSSNGSPARPEDHTPSTRPQFVTQLPLPGPVTSPEPRFTWELPANWPSLFQNSDRRVQLTYALGTSSRSIPFRIFPPVPAEPGRELDCEWQITDRTPDQLTVELEVEPGSGPVNTLLLTWPAPNRDLQLSIAAWEDASRVSTTPAGPGPLPATQDRPRPEGAPNTAVQPAETDRETANVNRPQVAAAQHRSKGVSNELDETPEEIEQATTKSRTALPETGSQAVDAGFNEGERVANPADAAAPRWTPLGDTGWLLDRTRSGVRQVGSHVEFQPSQSTRLKVQFSGAGADQLNITSLRVAWNPYTPPAGPVETLELVTRQTRPDARETDFVFQRQASAKPFHAAQLQIAWAGPDHRKVRLFAGDSLEKPNAFRQIAEGAVVSLTTGDRQVVVEQTSFPMRTERYLKWTVSNPPGTRELDVTGCRVTQSVAWIEVDQDQLPPQPIGALFLTVDPGTTPERHRWGLAPLGNHEPSTDARTMQPPAEFTELQHPPSPPPTQGVSSYVPLALAILCYLLFLWQGHNLFDWIWNFLARLIAPLKPW